MEEFRFSDYLNFLEKKLNQSKQAEVTRQEISKIRELAASGAVMTKHVKQYQILKNLILSGCELGIYI